MEEISPLEQSSTDLLQPFGGSRRTFSVTSDASVHELMGTFEDRSLIRAGEDIRLKTCEDEKVTETAFKQCKRCLGGTWAKMKPNQLTVTYVTGGMTNYLYLCSLPDDVITLENEPRKVLMRIYGEIVDLKQRFYESIIFTVLSERNIGPKTYGVFYSGRIEEFYPYRTLVTQELKNPAIQKTIGERVAEFHCMKIPLNQEAQFIWENIEKFLSMILTVEFEDAEKQERLEAILQSFNFETEYIWMKSMLMNVKSPIVFCHNDVHEGNLIYVNDEIDPDDFDIRLIDFDYSSYNYRGFDIGNHFSEHLHEYSEDFPDGVICTQENYPTREEQENFARSYLDTIQRMRVKVLTGEKDPLKYNCDYDAGSVDELLNEANRLALAANFYWAVWSIIQEKVSKISMNYLKHTEDRIVTYRLLKDKYCSK